MASALSAGSMSAKWRVRPSRRPTARATTALSPVNMTLFFRRFVARRDVDCELLGLDPQCLRYGMSQLRFRRRRQPEQMTRRDVVLIGEHVENGGCDVGQGPGLVEDDGI